MKKQHITNIMENNTDQILFNELSDDDLSFIYLGQFDNTVLGMATELWKGYMAKSADTEGQKNKVSFLMIESFQNILRYGLSGRPDDETSGEIFVVRRKNNSYYITSGNYVDNSKIGYIKQKLEMVNSMTADELKQIFVETLTNKQLSKEGGAGLGFVEMIRKTKEKLDFKFVPIDDNHSFFYFQLRLKCGIDDSEPISIDRTEYIKKIMEDHHKFIAVKGDFDRNAVNQILMMAENNIAVLDPQLTTQRKVYHIMVEMIQNISKHAKVSDKGARVGLFSIGKAGTQFTLTATNRIKCSEIQTLKAYIDNINNKDQQALDDYYRHILRNGHDDLDVVSGLGLIDIVRESKFGIKYMFDNEKPSYDPLLTMECNI